MTAADQIAVAGTLDGGAIASIHFRGGLSRATNLHWEINGTDGDLVVTGTTGHLQYGRVTIHGARASDSTPVPLPIPRRYLSRPGSAGFRMEQLDANSYAYAVVHLYAEIFADLIRGTQTVPDFGHALRRHRMLEQFERAAATGRRQTRCR